MSVPPSVVSSEAVFADRNRGAERVLSYLRAHGGHCDHTELLKVIKLKATAFKTIIHNLIDQRVLTVEKRGRRTIYRLLAVSC